MPQITIPASIEEATASLSGLDALLKAKEWERAAIVYAFTTPGEGGPRTGGISSQLSIREFAEKGIVGLTDRGTVTEYRKNWQWAIDNGMAVAVTPGDSVTLPTIKWPPLDHKRGSHATKDEIIEGIRAEITADPKAAIAQIVYDHPEIAPQIAEGALANPATRVSIEAQLAAPVTPTPATVAVAPRARDYRADLITGTNLVISVVRAIERGDYTPTGAEEMLLGLVGQMLTSRTTGTPQPSLFDQIDAHLRGSVRP